MSTDGDDVEARIDAWVQEQLAASPSWSKEKRDAIVAILELNDPEGIGAAQAKVAREPRACRACCAHSCSKVWPKNP